jgi:hypothetical protein
MGDQPRLRLVGDVEDRQPAVAPAGVGRVAGDERVVEGVAAVARPIRRLASGAVQAG